MRLFNTILFLLIGTCLFAQVSKKAMDPSVYGDWNRVSNVSVSNNGEWILYRLTSEEGDPSLMIYEVATEKNFTFERAKNASFDKDSEYVFFHSIAAKDSVKLLKRQKTKKSDMPEDTLSIYKLDDRSLLKIPGIKSYKTPKKWGGYLFYHLLPNNPQPDTSAVAISVKKESDDNGSKLIIRNLVSSKEDTMSYITDFTLAEEGEYMAAVSQGDDSLLLAGIYCQDLEKGKTYSVNTTKAKYKHLNFSRTGSTLAYLTNQDTTNAQVTPYDLFMFDTRTNKNQKVLSNGDKAIPKGFIISGDRSPSWTYDGGKMYFGLATMPILQDTSLLEEEIVNVEVWHYQDQLLYTQQENKLNKEKKRSYQYQYDIKTQKISGLADLQVRNVFTSNRGKNDKIVGVDNQNYEKFVSWKGYDFFDLFVVDTKTGNKQLIQKKLQGQSLRLSPSGKYFTWYSNVDSMWMLLDLKEEKIRVLTDNSLGTFYSEIHDTPSHPWAYGRVGWTQNEEKVWLYDRYDIWEVDPTKERSARKITEGRRKETRYRRLNLDREDPYIRTDQDQLMHLFNDYTKSQGYAWLKKGNVVKPIMFGKYQLSRRPYKAKDADVLVYTKEDLSTFPNLLVSNASFNKTKQVSHANPQQSAYLGANAELIAWTGLNGDAHQGMLFTPENLDPNKKYPMIVNFYEKSSNRFYQHRAPYAHRSTINYSYYLSKGYVIFNPDIHYKDGYPGQSCYNSLMPGVDMVLEKGFVDEERMGLQGHSWGGYQIADLLTRTDRFKCAESGAPVVNMVSAYGGIRWGSGLSRMFQYERTQSRLGATLWERPDLYLENSPIFKMDKVTTPVLILHNDEDGAVPWYQGIEYFVAMRRLGKPAWLLNYNKEPHWPVKWQNRKDFNIRMEQFFDHYLMNKPMPKWMKSGVPAIEKGIRQGMETDSK